MSTSTSTSTTADTTTSTIARAAIVRVPGGPDSIEVVEVPVGEPGPGEVRVRVAAASINPVDLAVAAGGFHGSFIHQTEQTGLGWDLAGTVEAVGEGVDPGTGLVVGARVAAIAPGFDRPVGAYAERLVVGVDQVALVPDELDLAAAATLPVNGLAAMQILDILGDAPAGADRLLVTGAAGTVGVALLVLAPERGWQVTGLARAHDEALVTGFGADFTTETTGGWDAVADAAAMKDAALALVRDGGRFVGVQPGADLPSERGITPEVVVTVPDPGQLARLVGLAAAGVLPTRVHATYPLEQAAEAQRVVAAGGFRGKVVLVP
jgi:NADPH:quinone reductase-like Zn-dependent oxidoreductase